MKNLLLAAAIGDISGVPYEFKGRTKNYDAVDLLNPDNTYSDDTICTFACAEALLEGKDMAECLHRRGREDFQRGFGGHFARWLICPEIKPSYRSYGNGSSMRCSSAGFLAKTKEEFQYYASTDCLYSEPEKSLDFYNMRRKKLSEVEPNEAHRLIAELEKEHEVTVITQNVDNLQDNSIRGYP